MTITATALLVGCQGILGIQNGTARKTNGGAGAGGLPEAGGTGGNAGRGGTAGGGNAGTGGTAGTGNAGTGGGGTAGAGAGGTGGTAPEGGPDAGGTGGTAPEGGPDAGGTGGTAPEGGPDAGGTGGGAPGTLGSKCKTDTDCAAGLRCAQPTGGDFGPGGPANGYCTKTCGATSDCTSFDPKAHCIPTGSGMTLCLEGCDPNGTNDCQGRTNSLCVGVVESSINSGPPLFVCYPWCSSDADCNGRYCDMSTGLCSTTRRTGLPIGSNCNPQAMLDGGTDPCTGLCSNDVGAPPDVGSCSTLCDPDSLGILGQCGSSSVPGSKQDAACIFTTPSDSAAGECGQLCNCNSECRTTGYVCAPWTTLGVSTSQAQALGQAFHQAGYCRKPENPEGGMVSNISCPTDGGT